MENPNPTFLERQEEHNMKNERLREPWEKAVFCAISNSIEYRVEPISVSTSLSGNLHDSCVTFIRSKARMDAAAAEQVYQDLLQQASKQKRPMGKIPFLIPAGILFGIVATIGNGYVMADVGFNLPSILFFLISVSIAWTSIQYAIENYHAVKASKVWDEDIKTGSSMNQIAALEQMASIFPSKEPTLASPPTDGDKK